MSRVPMGMNRLNMDTAGVDALGGEMHCLLAGPVLTIDGRGRNALGETGAENCHTRCRRLFTDLAYASNNNIIDPRRIKVVPCDDGAQYPCKEVYGVNTGQSAAGLALGDRRADGMPMYGGARKKLGARSSPDPNGALVILGKPPSTVLE